MKDTFYFPHDYNARGDEKITMLLIKHGARGYGVYWMLIEKLYEAGGKIMPKYETLAFDFREPLEIIKSVVEDFDLFYFTSDILREAKIGSKSVDRRLQERRQRSRLLSEAGKMGRARQLKENKVGPGLAQTEPRQERKERKERNNDVTTAAPLAIDYSKIRINLGKNYPNIHVTSIPVDECRVLLGTPRLGAMYKAALEWRIAQKKAESAR